jgi:ABC-2 type transport system ATP-binding protein
MRILACFMPASSGAAKVAGYDVFAQSMEVRRRIGYLPENVPLYTDMRGGVPDFVAEVKGRTAGRRRADVMVRYGEVDVQNRLIAKLSGLSPARGARAGDRERSRRLIDRRLLTRPQQITEIRSSSSRRRSFGDLSTHILPEVSMVCDAVIIITGGMSPRAPSHPGRAVLPDLAARGRDRRSPVVRERIRAIPGVLSVEDQPPANGVGRYTVEAARVRTCGPRSSSWPRSGVGIYSSSSAWADARGGLHRVVAGENHRLPAGLH